jgi:hypothetical protein
MFDQRGEARAQLADDEPALGPAPGTGAGAGHPPTDA